MISQVPAFRATPNSMSTSTDPHHSATSSRDLTRRCYSDMVTKQEKQSLHSSERLGKGHILREHNSQGGLKRRDGTHHQQPVVIKNVHVAGVGWASLVSMAMHTPHSAIYPLQLSTGEVLVQYNNGEQMKLNPTGINSGAVHTDTQGHQTRLASFHGLCVAQLSASQISKQQSYSTNCESKTFPLPSSC